MTRLSKKLVTTAAVTLIVAFTAAPAVLASVTLQVVSSQAVGTAVQVDLVNTATSPKTGLVVVYAWVDGQLLRSQTPITLGAGETATTVNPFPGPVDDISSVSVIMGSGDPIT